MSRGKKARDKRRLAREQAQPSSSDIPVVNMQSLQDYIPAIWDGRKFAGGLPDVDQLLLTDYWTLRKRSTELFERNLYARGIIRRLVTNEINVGLSLESIPNESLLGKEETALADWAERTETIFEVAWASDPWGCDAYEQKTFGQIQADAKRQAYISGDVLVVLRQNVVTGLPQIQLIKGELVQTPMQEPRAGNKICHGVEFDSKGRQVAYWIVQDDGTSKRLPAFGEKSGRRLSWLLYGTDHKLDDVRGQPLLAIVIQSLKEIDRYRDATQRKAVIASMLAMFVEKTQERVASKALTGGSTRKGIESTIDTHGKRRNFQAAEQIPGVVVEELQYGEKPQVFGQNIATEGYAVFEAAVLQAIAWALEIPPEILLLSFNSNYSASKAANNEFDMYLNKVRTEFGDNFCRPIYVEWIVAATLAGVIKADGLVEAWRDSKKFVEFGAWTACDWTGQIKPSIDLAKVMVAYKMAMSEGLTTRTRACREIFGMKFERVIKQLARENKMLFEANKPLAELLADPFMAQLVGQALAEPVDEPSKPAKNSLRGRLEVIHGR